jgi:phosphoribosylglycinamide formyltransferase-1
MAERFISEPITPVEGTLNLAETPVGEPPLPQKFIWRDVEYTVDKILDKRKELGRDATHGSKEKYLRKHWFRVRTTSGHTMNIYFERRAKSKAQRLTRWWLYTLVEDDDSAPKAP